MPANMSRFLARKLLDHVFQAPGSGAYSQPTHLYIGLSTTTIADDGSGGTEPSGNAYARVQADGLFAAASNADPAVVASSGAITFPTATGAWGTITYWFLADASTGGNILWAAPLDTSRVVINGDTPRFSTGDLSVSLT